jgi:hypothetical protein
MKPLEFESKIERLVGGKILSIVPCHRDGLLEGIIRELEGQVVLIDGVTVRVDRVAARLSLFYRQGEPLGLFVQCVDEDDEYEEDDDEDMASHQLAEFFKG